MRIEPPALAAGTLPPAGPYEADIIILTMGRVAATLAAIESALQQSQVRAYVAVLDQNATPASQDAYRRAFAGRARIGYFASAANLGVGGGRNVLAAIGHGQIIVGLDNDAAFADAFVVFNTVRAFRQDEKLGALGFRIMNGAGTGPDEQSWGYPPALKALGARRFLTTTFVGAGHAIRRACWADAGPYDATLFFTWEEYDFALRAIARGWTVAYRGDLAVRHLLAAEARMRWQGGRTRLFVRNRLLIARKWGAPWVSLLPRICGYVVKGALHGQAPAALSGIAAAWRRDKLLQKQNMPRKMRDYIRAHETSHRGNLIQRLGREVFNR
jgi:GT2 family glycosyltransferase